MENQPTSSELLDNFRAHAEKNGMATAPVNDGRVFMFKSEYLRRLVLTGTTPYLRFGIKQADGSVKDVLLDRDKLRVEAEATTEPYILVFVSDGPIQN